MPCKTKTFSQLPSQPAHNHPSQAQSHVKSGLMSGRRKTTKCESSDRRGSKKCDRCDQQNHNNRKSVCYAFVIQNDIWRHLKVSDSTVLLRNLKIGAGEGNRTLISAVSYTH